MGMQDGNCKRPADGDYPTAALNRNENGSKIRWIREQMAIPALAVPAGASHFVRCSLASVLDGSVLQLTGFVHCQTGPWSLSRSVG
jgi:hypothetical protein